MAGAFFVARLLLRGSSRFAHLLSIYPFDVDPGTVFPLGMMLYALADAVHNTVSANVNKEDASEQFQISDHRSSFLQFLYRTT